MLSYSRYAKVRFRSVSSVARWRPKSPADVRQESDGVCSDFGADNTLGFLRNHQQLRWETIACVPISEGSLCFFLSRRERRRKLSLEQRHESPLCVTSVKLVFLPIAGFIAEVESIARSSDENPLFATPEGVPLGKSTKPRRKRFEFSQAFVVLCVFAPWWQDFSAAPLQSFSARH